MSYKLYDWECFNEDCVVVGQRIEMLTASDERPTCPECQRDLARLMPAPVGYVSTYNVFRAKGRKNRVRNVFKKVRDD